MATAFDNYSKPLQGESNAELTPYAQVVSQQAKGGYQSIPDATKQTASATKAGTLAANRQNSYINYISQVVQGDLPGDEASLRDPYIPKNQGTASYLGSGYVDRNVKMAPNAIPSAYNYAGIANDSNPYRMDRLEWGGPSSGKTSNPIDYVPFGTLSNLKGSANSYLQNALIPDNIASDVSNGLLGKWMGGWNSKFSEMANDRLQQQDSWWNQSDWSNKSIVPAWNEVISEAVPGIPEIPYQPAVYEDIPARRELVTPEVKAVAEVPYRAAQHNLITPEQQYVPAVAAGYYTPNQTEYTNWVNSEYDRLLNDTITLTRNGTGETYSFKGKEADAWQDEYARHRDAMLGLYAGVPVGAQPTGTNGSTNFDPSSPNNYFRYADVNNPGGQGRFTSHFDVFNSTLGYDPWGNPTSYLDLWSNFPTQWGDYQDGRAETPYRAAVYEDIPEQQYVPPVNYQPAVYKEIPAQRNLVRPEVLGRPAVPGIPEVNFYHPQANKPGFETVIDPITGMEIPNYYRGGPFNSNPELQSAYGSAGWYFK